MAEPEKEIIKNIGLYMRPVNIDQVIGNAAAVEFIKSKSPETLPKAFIISGDPGCGKTTLARIIFDILGAEDECIREYNMVTEGLKGTVREIEDDCQFKPGFGKINGWLMDEAHGSTKDTLSGFLKILEDSPDFNYFIFCTSDVNAFLKKFTEKERKAFFRRCTELKVGPVTDNEGFDLIDECLGELDIPEEKISESVIEAILKISAGVPSNMYKNLETIIDLDNEAKMLDHLKSAGDGAEAVDPEIMEMSRAILEGNWKECCRLIKGFKKARIGHEALKWPIMGYMQSVLLGDENLTNTVKNQRAYACIELLKTLTYDGGIYAFTTSVRYVCQIGRGSSEK